MKWGARASEEERPPNSAAADTVCISRLPEAAAIFSRESNDSSLFHRKTAPSELISSSFNGAEWRQSQILEVAHNDNDHPS